MSTTVTLPKNAVSQFDLPKVCVATGATEGISYHKVKFQFVPMWARLSVAFCGLIGVVLMLINTRRVEAEIPFTDEAYARFKRSRIVPVFLILGAIPLMFLPMLIDEDLIILGALAFIAMVIGAVVYAQVVSRSAGPICKEITEDSIILEIPNEDAARAMDARLMGGGAPPAPNAF